MDRKTNDRFAIRALAKLALLTGDSLILSIRANCDIVARWSLESAFMLLIDDDGDRSDLKLN